MPLPFSAKVLAYRYICLTNKPLPCFISDYKMFAIRMLVPVTTAAIVETKWSMHACSKPMSFGWLLPLISFRIKK